LQYYDRYFFAAKIFYGLGIEAKILCEERAKIVAHSPTRKGSP